MRRGHRQKCRTDLKHLKRKWDWINILYFRLITVVCLFNELWLMLNFIYKERHPQFHIMFDNSLVITIVQVPYFKSTLLVIRNYKIFISLLVNHIRRRQKFKLTAIWITGFANGESLRTRCVIADKSPPFSLWYGICSSKTRRVLCDVIVRGNNEGLISFQ